MKRSMGLTFVLSFVFAITGGTSLQEPPTTYVQYHGASYQSQFATQVCAGLFNRDASVMGPAYVFSDSRDGLWLNATGSNVSGINSDVPTFLHRCLHGDGTTTAAVAKGWIRYNYSAHKIIVPNIVTLAAVLDGIPLEDSAAHELGLTSAPLLDLVQLFPDTADTAKAPRVATQFVFDNYLNLTKGMSKMNPGIDVHGKHKLNPPLTGSASLGLVDYIVKERLFNFFLNLGCVPLTDDHALMKKIANNNPWPRPVVVYGYDDTVAVAGDLFEAETDCVNDLGQVASNGCSNLGFYSRKPSISVPLKQVADPSSILQPFNQSKTYITVIIGDGDNVNFVKGEHFDWMKERVAMCSQSPQECFPLTWTQSPAVLHLAPDWMRWYYEQAHLTGKDWFVLPPSGDTYSYPGEMDAANQAKFVSKTEQDAYLMNSSGTVSWEFTGTWGSAIKNFFPRFATKGIVKGCFAVNVPYMLPVVDFSKGEHYKILKDEQGHEVVLFAPREWRGNGTSTIPLHLDAKSVLSAQAMAEEVNKYPGGTVTHLYTTSDGGFNLDQLRQMVGQLREHVEVVNANEIVLRAMQRG